MRVLAKAAHGEWSRVLLGTGTAIAPTPHQAPTSLAPALLPTEVGVQMLDGETANTQKGWSQLGSDPLGFCSSNLGPASAPERLVLATLDRG